MFGFGCNTWRHSKKVEKKNSVPCTQSYLSQPNFPLQWRADQCRSMLWIHSHFAWYMYSTDSPMMSLALLMVLFGEMVKMTFIYLLVSALVIQVVTHGARKRWECWKCRVSLSTPALSTLRFFLGTIGNGTTRGVTGRECKPNPLEFVKRSEDRNTQSGSSGGLLREYLIYCLRMRLI